MKKEYAKIVMGVDVSKDKLDICILSVNSNFEQKVESTRTFENTQKGIENLIDYWSIKTTNHPNGFIVMESTGTYHEGLAYTLYSRNINVCIELANKIKHFGKSLNVKTKTDKKDSILIAKYGAQNTLRYWQPCSKNELNLKQMTRLRLACSKVLISAKNRMHALSATPVTDPQVLYFVSNEIEFYSAQIAKVDEQIESLIENDDVLKRKSKILMSIPGVGIITTATVIAETGGFQTFYNVRSLVSYAGLDVAHKESGNSSKKPQISKKGNEKLRTGLYMASLSAAHKAQTLIPLYERVCSGNNIKKKGIIAVMRKVLILMYTLWKTEEMYDPEYITKK